VVLGREPRVAEPLEEHQRVAHAPSRERLDDDLRVVRGLLRLAPRLQHPEAPLSYFVTLWIG
jgi:hypothetical protein